MKFAAKSPLAFARESGCLADFGDCLYKLNIAAGKRNEIAGKQGNETEPIAACAVVGFLIGLL